MLDLRSRPHCGAHALPPVAREGDTPSGCPTLQVSRQMYASSPCSSLINCVVKHFHMLRPAENVFAWQVVYRWTGWQHHPHGRPTHTTQQHLRPLTNLCVCSVCPRPFLFMSTATAGAGGAHGEPAVARNNYGRRKKLLFTRRGDASSAALLPQPSRWTHRLLSATTVNIHPRVHYTDPIQSAPYNTTYIQYYAKKYLVLNRTRKLRATNYCNADF